MSTARTDPSGTGGTAPSSGSSGSARRPSPVSARTVAGALIVVALAIWILTNRTRVSVTFWFTSATLPLWVALTVAAVLGCAAGFLLGRRRYLRR